MKLKVYNNTIQAAIKDLNIYIYICKFWPQREREGEIQTGDLHFIISYLNWDCMAFVAKWYIFHSNKVEILGSAALCDIKMEGFEKGLPCIM